MFALFKDQGHFYWKRNKLYEFSLSFFYKINRFLPYVYRNIFVTVVIPNLCDV